MTFSNDLKIFSSALALGPVLRVAEHGPRTVIQLQAAAASIIKVTDHGSISGDNIIDERVLVRIDCFCDRDVFLPVKLIKQMRRSRESFLYHCILIGKLLGKAEIIDDGMMVPRKLSRKDCRIPARFLPFEEIAMGKGFPLDSAKAPHKIKVPIFTAKLPIRQGAQAKSLFLADEFADFLIFHAAQGSLTEGAGAERLTCLFEAFRTQETAYNIKMNGTLYSHDDSPLR